ncbi:MAG: hypothetical protein JWL83_1698 [Actinomycetia bacterium]|nr:hypothetical protein [Actinomycetes bacterium]
MQHVDVTEVPASEPGGATVRPPTLDTGSTPTHPRRRTFIGLRRVTLVVITLALITVVSTTVLIGHVVADSEHRQLQQRAREASVVLQSLVDRLESPMRTAAVVMRGIGASDQIFQRLAGPVSGPGKTVAAAALLRLDPPRGAPRVVAHTGGALALSTAPAASGLGTVNGHLTLVNLLQSRLGHRLGLVLGPPAMPDGYAVYAEVQFPIPGVSLRDAEVFSDLDYAVYVGSTPHKSSMVFGTVDAAITGERTTARVPVGNSEFILVASPRGHLTGALAAALPWLVLAVGLIGTTSGAAALEAIGRRRDSAVKFAGELAERSAELILTQAQLAELNTSLELAVEERTSELRAANRELESFSYAVAHDLRAPLRAIDGFSLALVEDYGDLLDEQGRHYAQRVRAATARMGELIDDLLTLSRVARSELQREPVDLSSVARSVLARLAEATPARVVDIVVVDGATARGDPRLLRIALENLLGNAWKFSSTKPVARIEFGTTRDAGRNAYFVRDNGVGFDSEYATKLFNPFQRLHSSDEFEGNGIGLATVARVVYRHGGRVWAEGAIGEGATFYFTTGDTRGGGA